MKDRKKNEKKNPNLESLNRILTFFSLKKNHFRPFLIISFYTLFCFILLLT